MLPLCNLYLLAHCTFFLQQQLCRCHHLGVSLLLFLWELDCIGVDPLNNHLSNHLALLTKICLACQRGATCHMPNNFTSWCQTYTLVYNKQGWCHIQNKTWSLNHHWTLWIQLTTFEQVFMYRAWSHFPGNYGLEPVCLPFRSSACLHSI